MPKLKLKCHCGGEVRMDTKKHAKDDGLASVTFYCFSCKALRKIIAETKKDAIAAFINAYNAEAIYE